jgi:hypothetical protein
VHEAPRTLARALVCLLAVQAVQCESQQEAQDRAERRRKIEQARVFETRARMAKLRNGLEIFRVSLARYPTDEQGGLEALIRMPAEDEAVRARWKGPYAEQADLVDAWGRPIQYSLLEDAGSGRSVLVPLLTSAGPDGRIDTDDDIHSPEETDE